MKLLNLKITNFKGVHSFELPLDGRSAIVSGTNGAGKTTLFDAFMWLLFGKDSGGRSETNFEVKPYGSQGLTVEVVGEFEHDGRLFTLGKTLAEKFTKINGEDETERKPKNEYTYYIDGVPKPKNQYTAYIADICPEDTFRLLSDPDYFAGKIDWKKRRKMLIDYFGELSDRTIIRKHTDELGELMNLIGCKSVADYKVMSIAERKKVIAELEGIPARIDEAEKAKPTEMPKEDDGARLGLLTMQKKALEQRISDMENGVETAKQRSVIAELQAAFATQKAEYTTTMTDSTALAEAKERHSTVKDKLADIAREIRRAESDKATYETKRKELLNEYREIGSRTFDESSTVCPTCGREYPEEKQQELKAIFHHRRAGDLEANKTQGLAVKNQIQTYTEELTKLEQLRSEYGEHLREMEEEISRLLREKPVPFEETETGKALQEKIAEEQRTLAAVLQDKGAKVAELQEQLAGWENELAAINRRMAAEAQVKQQDKRIAQLKAQAKELGGRRADLEHGIELAERFEQIKLGEIEDSVNSQFQYAKFKLFNRQINGGIAECCEVTVGGIPYTTNLNTAAKANAGLDIINVISKKMNITAPIWLDGAESVVRYLPVEAQTIQLAVDGGSDQLRVYVEE